MTSEKVIRAFGVLAGLQLLLVIFVFIATAKSSITTHAVMGMALGLIVFWVIGFGYFSFKSRDAVKRVFERLPGRWEVKFAIFATLLALLEEVVTTAMTNTAPLYGLRIGQAYITASANYWDVVLGHSVIVFAPMFVFWAWFLRRYRFSANQVLLLFGLTGTLAEMGYSGAGHITEIGLWMFVYGLMVYLPAYCVPERPAAKEPSKWLYPVAVFMPFLFIPLAGPLIIFIHRIRPSSLTTFPPIIK